MSIESKETLELITTGLKSLSGVLKVMAKRVDALADSVGNLESDQQPDFTESEIENQQTLSAESAESDVIDTPVSKPNTSRKRKVKKHVKRNKKSEPIRTVIYQLIAENPHGISVNGILSATNFDRKQVSNALHRLKSQGYVTNIAKGVYVTVG